MLRKAHVAHVKPVAVFRCMIKQLRDPIAALAHVTHCSLQLQPMHIGTAESVMPHTHSGAKVQHTVF